MNIYITVYPVWLSLACILVLCFVVTRFLKRHKWSYRLAFDRTCKVCGKREVFFPCGGMVDRGRWATIKLGNKEAHSIRLMANCLTGRSAKEQAK